jgi:hypothetical protein
MRVINARISGAINSAAGMFALLVSTTDENRK